MLYVLVPNWNLSELASFFPFLEENSTFKHYFNNIPTPISLGIMVALIYILIQQIMLL